MRRFDLRIVFGSGLIVLGLLLLLEEFAILPVAASGIFGGLVMLVGAAYFFWLFSSNVRGLWWAIIPAMALLGLGANSLLPDLLSGWGGAVFLGALGLGFFVIYAGDRIRWWAIIPGGVLLTLAAISVLSEGGSGLDSGSLLFLGLGATFLLVAILPTPAGNMQWAFIPALVLLLMGVFLGNSQAEGIMTLVGPGLLILFGLGLVVRFFLKRD